MKLAYAPYMLDFKRPAGTSRGILTQKPTCLIKIWDESAPEVYGIGEAALFPGLSPECGDRFGFKMLELLANVNLGRSTDLTEFSSIQYGFEQALYDFANGGKGIYVPSSFVLPRSEDTLEINGLIWMGDYDFMLEQISEKLAHGFHCIKVKIGSIDWHCELEMLRLIRTAKGGDKIVLRVDANCAFTQDIVKSRLWDLADLDVHSIEQPVAVNQRGLLAELCADTPVPIALDESLIGVYRTPEKRSLLDDVKPQYIILKPALCGGFSGAEEWIRLAEERGIGWWVTSALESNLGLNALAQWTASLRVSGAQGLGTGALYTNNFECPLLLEGDKLRYDSSKMMDRQQFEYLDWRY